jgi:hypothetical protein
VNGTRFSIDPPDDDGPDPDRCDCGAELIVYTEEPGGQRERVCPTCDRALIAGELGGDEPPDSEATQRADYLLDQADDEKACPF